MEKRIATSFIDYLVKHKGYKNENFLIETPLLENEVDEQLFNKYVVDLLILDIENNNYLAAIQTIQDSTKINKNNFDQLKKYFTDIGKSDLNLYMLTQKTENSELLIYAMGSEGFKEISKEDFPELKTLVSKKQADEKDIFYKIENNKKKSLETKKNIAISTAWSSLASLIAGVITVLIFTKKTDGISFFLDKTDYRDSITVLQKNLDQKILKINKEIHQLKNKDSVQSVQPGNIELKTRISAVENLINHSPDRLLKIQELTFQLNALRADIQAAKEINDIKFANIKDSVDNIMIWTSGLIITLFGSIIGFAINTFRKTH